jgi:UDP-2,3-diacylglucosamine pyrophosphatase LpxH
MSHEFIYEGADRRRFLVLHGDQFDGNELHGTWLKQLGARSYDMLVWADHQWNEVLRRLNRDEIRFSSHVKRRFRRAARFIADYEIRLADYARAKQCHGVICGHIHVPQMRSIDGVLYCNTGDWVEHCTALTTSEDGSLELVDYTNPERPVVLSDSPALPSRKPSLVPPVRPSVAALAAEL